MSCVIPHLKDYKVLWVCILGTTGITWKHVEHTTLENKDTILVEVSVPNLDQFILGMF